MRSIPLGENFAEFIKNYKGRVVLTMHHQADLDAVGSTIAMIHLISILNPSIIIHVLEPNLSQLSQQMMTISSYQFNQIKIKEIDFPALIILLDLNQIELGLKTSKNSYIIINCNELSVWKKKNSTVANLFVNKHPVWNRKVSINNKILINLH